MGKGLTSSAIHRSGLHRDMVGKKRLEDSLSEEEKRGLKKVLTEKKNEKLKIMYKAQRLTKRLSDKNILTREFHRLAVDDEVRQLLGNLSTLLLVLRKVELLTQLHVKNLHVREETGWTNMVLQAQARLHRVDTLAVQMIQ